MAAECKVQYRILSILYSSFLNLLHPVFILLLCHIKIQLIFSLYAWICKVGFFPRFSCRILYVPSSGSRQRTVLRIGFEVWGY